MKLLFEVSLVTVIPVAAEAGLRTLLDYALHDGLRLALPLHEGQNVVDVIWHYVSSFSKRVELPFSFWHLICCCCGCCLSQMLFWAFVVVFVGDGWRGVFWSDSE